jgi:tetratricopeptide (TPR) repeat protein
MLFQFWLIGCFLFSILDILIVWAGSGGSFRRTYKRIAWRNFRWTVKLNFVLVTLFFVAYLIAYSANTLTSMSAPVEPTYTATGTSANSRGVTRLDPAIHAKQGKAYVDRGESAKAVSEYQKAIDGYRALAAAQPGVPGHQAGLAGSYYNLGLTFRTAGEPSKAAEAFQKSVLLYKDAIVHQPHDPDLPGWLAGALSNDGQILATQGRHEEAVSRFREAISYQRPLVESQPQATRFRRFLSWHYSLLAHSLTALGSIAEAAQATRELTKLWPQDPGQLYYCAQCFSYYRPLTSDDAQKRALAQEATQTLRRAVAAGFRDGLLMARDPYLIPLHDRAEFQHLVAELLDRFFPAEPFAP